MKTIVLSTILLMVTVLTGMGQKPDFKELCQKYQDDEEIVNLHVNHFGCFLLSLFADKEANGEEAIAQNFIRKSSSFRLLVSEGNKRPDLVKDVNKYIKESKLDELMTVKEKAGEVKIYVQDKDKVIRQLFISIVDAEEDAVFLQIEGKFTREMIKKLVKTDR